MAHILQGQKYFWKLPEHDIQKVLDIASSYSLSMPLAQTLLSRGFETKEQINDYLFSEVDKDVFNPELLKDAPKAVDRINLAIENKEKILIFGDYDVDGITSSALMIASLQPLGALVNFYLPHRVKEGYGLSTKVVQRAAANGYKVIITVDNGITAFEQALEAKKLGVDLIITDHHQPHGKVPEAFAIVNPHQKECPYPYNEFAGVGVSFKVMSLLYQRRGIQLPQKVYELLLLGTVADVVPLTGENRFWVRYGLQWINAHDSVSFRVLKENGKVTKDKKITSTDIGFKITPQINALGRLEDARQGVHFLLGTDPQETSRIGGVLLELNQTRRDIERKILDEVRSVIRRGQIDIEKENLILAGGKDWPPGVIGLVASRLVAEFGKPAILLHMTDKGIAKGSCRSIPEFNIFEALSSCEDLLNTFGGHAAAAGLSLDADKVPEFKHRMEERIAQMLTPQDLQQKITVDGTITLPEVSQKLVQDMQHFEPFGCANREPTFVVKDVAQVQKPQLLKGEHVKTMVFADGIVKPVIFFGRPDLFTILQNQKEESFSIAVKVSENHWNGRVAIELQGIDVSTDKE